MKNIFTPYPLKSFWLTAISPFLGSCFFKPKIKMTDNKTKTSISFFLFGSLEQYGIYIFSIGKKKPNHLVLTSPFFIQMQGKFSVPAVTHREFLIMTF